MGKRFRQDWRGISLKNGMRYLCKEIDFVGITLPLKEVKKISLWQRLWTAIARWWERLIIKLRRNSWA